MIELDKQHYEKAIPIIRSAAINTLFALSVLEKKVEGKVFVDDEYSPTSYYVQHPYGMALLYGETNKEDFYQQLVSHMLNLEKARSGFEWLQVYPASLYSKIDNILGINLVKKNSNDLYKKTVAQDEDDKVLEYQRINFLFNKDKFATMERKFIDKNRNYKVVITTETIFNQLEGSVVPKYFWNNYNDFMKQGIGYTLLENDQPVSTAFASFVIDNKLELGIETAKKYHGSGFGNIVCAELIEYCIEHGYEPVWSCNSGNIGSIKLAQKLGFEEFKRIPYYRLAK